jgi:menaquinone-dependent protoporphyrinogen IX oxidase
MFVFFLLLALYAQTENQTQVLFIYDNLKDSNKISIDALRNKLETAGIAYKEYDLKKSKRDDINLSEYDYILIYSEVRAFKIRRPLRKWLSRTESFKGKKIGAYVTGITDKYSYRAAKQFKSVITAKDGEIIDAVSSATRKLTEQQKKDKIDRFANRFIKLLE